jgi:hypothetical protein
MASHGGLTKMKTNSLISEIFQPNIKVLTALKTHAMSNIWIA